MNDQTFDRGLHGFTRMTVPFIRVSSALSAVTPMARRFLAFVFLALLPLTAARAQSAHWENSDSGDPSEVVLVFTDCAPDGDPQIPRIDGTALAITGRSENTSIVNFTMTRSVFLSYRARATKSGPLQIPAFTVQTNKGAIKVPAFTGGVPRTAADANIFSRLEPGARTVWAGEVFSLTYVLDVARRSFNQLGSLPEWNSAPLVIEDWSKFESAETVAQGEARLAIVCRSRGYSKSPGAITLNAANQLVNIQTGSVGFGLFSTPRIEQLAVTSDRPTLNVRPLPPAPAGFRGAVGQFKLTSKVVPTNAALGEPVTWTLELSGTGNWPDIAGLSQRDVSKDFNVVSPQAKRTPADGKLFDVTLAEDVVLVPTRGGSYTLGPVSFTYFDPAAGEYKTINTPPTAVTITAPTPVGPALTAGPEKNPDTPSPQLTGGSNKPASATQAKIDSEKSKIPPSPLGLPRDPLAGTAIAPAPLSLRALLTLGLLPFALVPLVWLALALRRAQQTDPLRPQRDAKQRLAATLAKIQSGQQSAISDQPTASGLQPSTSNFQPQQQPLLLQWQHDTAILFRLPHAAPPATALGDAAWTQLWREADRALYSTNATLPADWTTRAETALAAKRVSGFQPLAAFLPRNLLPFVAALALLFVLAPLASRLSAASPDAAYRAGDFAAAEQAWTAALAKAPTDAVLRHNLSLALAQQDSWGEAAAQASAAFVQNPASPSIRWQLALASNKAGYAPAALASFLPPGPLQTLAGRASPAVWQQALIAAAALAALALGVLIFGAYRQPSRLRTWTALSVLALALLLGLAAAASVHAYGPAADRRAVIAWRAGTLRSIPTEADTTQKTTALPAGALALQEKTLLGWVRLRFDNGQTGWVRREEVIALWR